MAEGAGVGVTVVAGLGVAGLGAAASYGSSTPRRPGFRGSTAVALPLGAARTLALVAGAGVLALSTGIALALASILAAVTLTLTFGAAALTRAMLAASAAPRVGALRSTITTTPPPTSPSAAARIHAP